MQVLQLNDPGVKAVLRNEALSTRARVGRGKFSVVLDGSKPDTVFHVTCDPVSYELHCGVTGVTGPHFSHVVDDWGWVEESKSGDSIYVFETERLTPTRESLEALRLAKCVMRVIDRAFGLSSEYLNTAHETLNNAQKAADQCGIVLPQTICDALEDLSYFVSNFPNAGLDLHSANFMVRPSTGELVLNDPLFDRVIFEEAWTRLSNNSRFDKERAFK